MITDFIGDFILTKNSKQPTLEENLTEIAKLIEQMEHGDLTLDQSLSHFERGVQLIKQAQKILQNAEQKVQILIEKSGQTTLDSYENKEE